MGMIVGDSTVVCVSPVLTAVGLRAVAPLVQSAAGGRASRKPPVQF